MIICKLCKREFNNLYGLVNHIKRGHKIDLKSYYSKFLKSNFEEYCNNPLCINIEENKPNYVQFIGLNGYKSYCSKKCQYQHLSNRIDVNIKRSKKMRKQWKNKESNLNSLKRTNRLSLSLTGKKFSKSRKNNISKSHLGQKAWNKGLKINDKTYLNNLKISHRRSIKEWKLLYPTFSKIEEMRYNPDKPGEKEIQVHCKNHNCENSKERGGWFTPNYGSFTSRIWSIEKDDGTGGSYLYCSDKCKEECPLYGKTVNQLIKQDKINAGIIEEPIYTSSEYQTFRQEVLQRANNKCEYCDEQATDAHHSRPQKLEPGFSLDPDYGIACCKECHYKYGHEKGSECSTGILANIICK